MAEDRLSLFLKRTGRLERGRGTGVGREVEFFRSQNSRPWTPCYVPQSGRLPRLFRHRGSISIKKTKTIALHKNKRAQFLLFKFCLWDCSGRWDTMLLLVVNSDSGKAACVIWVLFLDANLAETQRRGDENVVQGESFPSEETAHYCGDIKFRTGCWPALKKNPCSNHVNFIRL